MTKLAIIILCLSLSGCAHYYPCPRLDCYVNESFAGTGASIPTLSATYPVAGPSIKASSGKTVTAGRLR